MSYIGNTPGVSSQRVVLEEVVSGSPKSAFVPASGYIIGYVDVLVNGVEIDTTDFTAPDGVTINLVTAAAVGDTVKVKTWLPRGLSDGYLKTEADARYQAKDSNGNIAVGTTLKAWGSAHKVVQVGLSGALSSDLAGFTRLFNNVYSDGTNARFIGAGAGGMLLQYADGMYVYGAASGAADAVATLVNTLSVSRNQTMALQGGTQSAGAGIAFPATQNPSSDANTLDDYEEGTWTPTLTGSSTNPTVTYSSQYGTYTKVGRQVFIQFYLETTARSGGSGGVQIPLPFPVISNQSTYGGGAASQQSGLGMTTAGVRPIPGSSVLQIQVNTGATTMDIGSWTATGYILVGLSYATST